MLKLTNLQAGYDGKPVVSLSSLEVAGEERCLLAGPSGCGKTTLLYTMAGLMKPLAGGIDFQGEDIAAMDEPQRDHWRARHVGIVFQTLHLVPALSVVDNLMLAGYAADRAQDGARALHLLDRLGVAHLAARKPAEISQGQAQRVAVARAVMNRPALLLADEPTSSLDDAAARQTMALLSELAAESAAALVVSSHDGRIASFFTKTIRLGAQS